MVNSQNITVTETRARNAFESVLNDVAMPTVERKIKEAVEGERIRGGTVTKFYHYLDKAEVLIDGSKKKKVLCRIMHRFAGNLIDFYTPAGSKSYCDDLHEPCIIPRDPLHCLVLDIQDGTDEYILLGYDYPLDIVGFKPPYVGALKIVSFSASKENYITFGGKGLKIQANKEVEMEYGQYEDDITKVKYSNSDDVYTKDEVYNKTEVYTKEEVDELIKDKINEILNNTDGDGE